MNDERNDRGEDGIGRDARTEPESEVERGPPDERRDANEDDRSAPSSPPPGTDPAAGSSGAPGAETGRNWIVLALGLALVSLLTAAAALAVHDAVPPAAGAAVLALGFGAIVAGSLTRFPGIVGLLEDGWAEHRLYVWFATALFSFGIAIGGLLVAAGVDLTELFLELLMEEFDEEELADGGLEFSASFFIVQNTPPFLAAIFGALTLGLLTVLIMLVNGVLVGNIAAVVGSETGFGPIVLLLAPHGIFELSALFVAAGIGFRLLHRGLQRITGSREDLFTKAYLSRTAALVVFAWLVLVLAAFVEAYLTGVVAEAVFPELAAEQ